MQEITTIFELISTSEGKKSFQLWKNKDAKAIQKLETLVELEAGKLSQSNDALEFRIFFIKGSFLCYRKSLLNNKIRAHLDLKWATIQIISLGEEKEGFLEGVSFEVRIMKKDKMTKIYIKNEEDLTQLRYGLRDCGVLFTDFHQIYRPVKSIGKGGFSKVS